MRSSSSLPSSWLVLGLQLVRNVICFVAFIVTAICTNKICSLMNLQANGILFLGAGAVVSAAIAFLFITFVAKLDEQFDAPPTLNFKGAVKDTAVAISTALSRSEKKGETWSLVGASTDHQHLTFSIPVKNTTHGFFFFFGTTTTIQAPLQMNVMLTPTKEATRMSITFTHEGCRNHFRAAKEKAWKRLYLANQAQPMRAQEPAWRS